MEEGNKVPFWFTSSEDINEQYLLLSDVDKEKLRDLVLRLSVIDGLLCGVFVILCLHLVDYNFHLFNGLIILPRVGNFIAIPAAAIVLLCVVGFRRAKNRMLRTWLNRKP